MNRRPTEERCPEGKQSETRLWNSQPSFGLIVQVGAFSQKVGLNAEAMGYMGVVGVSWCDKVVEPDVWFGYESYMAYRYAGTDRQGTLEGEELARIGGSRPANGLAPVLVIRGRE